MRHSILARSIMKTASVSHRKANKSKYGDLGAIVESHVDLSGSLIAEVMDARLCDSQLLPTPARGELRQRRNRSLSHHGRPNPNPNRGRGTGIALGLGRMFRKITTAAPTLPIRSSRFTRHKTQPGTASIDVRRIDHAKQLRQRRKVALELARTRERK